MPLTRKLAAEFIGTFWLVLGGCGSAVLAAAFPRFGIGLMGVALAFGQSRAQHRPGGIRSRIGAVAALSILGRALDWGRDRCAGLSLYHAGQRHDGARLLRRRRSCLPATSRFVHPGGRGGIRGQFRSRAPRPRHQFTAAVGAHPAQQ